jgi:hypothetical protein
VICGWASADSPVIFTELDPRAVAEIEDVAAGRDFARLTVLIEAGKADGYYARAAAAFKALEENGRPDAIEFLLRYAFGPPRQEGPEAKYVAGAAQFFLKKHVLRQCFRAEQLAEYQRLLADSQSPYPRHLVVEALGELAEEGDEMGLEVLYGCLLREQNIYAMDQVARLAEAGLIARDSQWGGQFLAVLEKYIPLWTDHGYEGKAARAYFALVTQGQTLAEKIDHIASFLSRERPWDRLARAGLDQLPPEAADLLLERAESKDLPVEVRARMLYSLGEIGDRLRHPDRNLSAFTPDLIAFLETAEAPEIIRHAGAALAKWQAKEAVPALAKALKRLRTDHSEAAVYAKISLLDALSEMADASYVPLLMEFAKDTAQSVYVRRNAAVFAWEIQNKAAKQNQPTQQEFLDSLGIVVPPRE